MYLLNGVHPVRQTAVKGSPGVRGRGVARSKNIWGGHTWRTRAYRQNKDWRMSPQQGPGARPQVKGSAGELFCSPTSII